MSDDLLAHIDAMLTREMSTSASFLAEVRRLSALSGAARSIYPVECPNGHPGALLYTMPQVVRCPLCGIHDVAEAMTAGRL